VVVAHRLQPVPAGTRVVQFLEETAGIVGVGHRIERLVQRREGRGMVHQIDLAAANVDGAHAASLRLPHPVHRLCLGVEDVRFSFSVDRPGPGFASSCGLVAPAALDHADGLQDTGRDAVSCLGGSQCSPAHLAGRDQAPRVLHQFPGRNDGERRPAGGGGLCRRRPRLRRGSEKRNKSVGWRRCCRGQPGGGKNVREREVGAHREPQPDAERKMPPHTTVEAGHVPSPQTATFPRMRGDAGGEVRDPGCRNRHRWEPW
jgi:hypothetical protein